MTIETKPFSPGICRELRSAGKARSLDRLNLSKANAYLDLPGKYPPDTHLKTFPIDFDGFPRIFLRNFSRVESCGIKRSRTRHMAHSNFQPLLPLIAAISELTYLFH